MVHYKLSVLAGVHRRDRRRGVFLRERVPAEEGDLYGPLHMDLARMSLFYAFGYSAVSQWYQTFDALIHFSFEAIFLCYSVFGRQVATSEGVLPEMGTYGTRSRWNYTLTVLGSQGIRPG